MASRKPNLTLPLPEKEQPDFQRSTSSLRSPRFIEDFNAPFSEAIMNASSATLATDTMTFPSTTSSNDRASFGDEARPPPPFNRSNTGIQSPSPLRQRHSSWESETKRRAKINDRIREWARKSWGAARGRPDTRSGYFDGKHSRSSAALPCSPGEVSPTESEGYGRGIAYERAAATSTTLPKSSSA